MPRKAPIPPPPAATTRPSAPPLPAASSLPLAPHMTAKLTMDEFGGEEHRSFPRARIRVPFLLTIGKGPDVRFSATLFSRNLSVSGAFLESTFFLPVGTLVDATFPLDPQEEPVRVRAEVLRRHDAPKAQAGPASTGIAVRFTEFFGQTEVTLAKLFLGDRLRDFAERYLASKRAVSLRRELDRVIDALAAWELLKVTRPRTEDLWRGGN
jgi:hypothetical protein